MNIKEYLNLSEYQSHQKIQEQLTKVHLSLDKMQYFCSVMEFCEVMEKSLPPRYQSSLVIESGTSPSGPIIHSSYAINNLKFIQNHSIINNMGASQMLKSFKIEIEPSLSGIEQLREKMMGSEIYNEYLQAKMDNKLPDKSEIKNKKY